MSKVVQTAKIVTKTRAFAAQSGFTLVEVLVASVLLVTGLLATIGVLDSANHANNVAQRHQIAIGIAQRELEKTADLDYDQLALTGAPQSGQDENVPTSRVVGNNFNTEAGLEALVIGGARAAVSPGPETVNEGGVGSQVYRFITWVDAPRYQGCSQNCDSRQDYKRITVAVRTANGAFRGFDKYVLVSTLRIDPTLGPLGRVSQPADPDPTQSYNNFYLYDTQAGSCSSNTYQPPSGSHYAHDTRGYCASVASDFPDLMGIRPPPNPADPALPTLYKYSSDLLGNYPGGLAIQRQADCALGGLDKFQVHSWTTDPLSSSDYELTGKVSFDFWAGTVGGTPGNGKICVWLYDREMVSGQPQDRPIGNPPYTHTLANWPGDRTNLSFTFSHAPYTLPAGHQLRFVLTVSSQSASDLYFVYDYPTSPSFVQVRTTTPISP